MPSERVNLFSAELLRDDDDPEGYEAGYLRFGESIGAKMLGGTIYELGPGQSNCPYHYEYGNEEWVIVLAGRLRCGHPRARRRSSPATWPASPRGARARTS